MRPLAIILGSAAHDRLHAALSVAAAGAALGHDVHVYLHGEAVAAADPGFTWAEDARFAQGGAPQIRELIESALELGVAITACQTGLAMAGLHADAIDPRIKPGGLVGFLGGARDAEMMLG